MNAETMNAEFGTATTRLRRIRLKCGRAGRASNRRADLIHRAAQHGYLD